MVVCHNATDPAMLLQGPSRSAFTQWPESDSPRQSQLQVQMMSGYRDPKTVRKYDHHRESMDLNAVNFLSCDDEQTGGVGGGEK
jgi:hypothetical protein